MSQIVFSFNQSAIDKIIEEQEGFLKVTDRKVSPINCIAFGKINVVSTNHYQKNDDFAYIVGTYMHNGKTGKEVIEYVLNSFTIDRIVEYKKTIIGMWCALVYKNGKTFVFNDYYGLYDIAYTKNTVSNSIKHCLLSDGFNGINEYPFIMENFQLGALPGETPFVGIKKLKRKEFLEIGREITVKEIPGDLNFHYCFSTEDRAIEDLVVKLKKYASLIDEVFGSPSIFLTGGLDSRLVFSAFNAIGSNFVCRYGTGKYTQDSDKKIVEQITREYNKRLNIIDWNVDDGEKCKNQNILFSKIGFYNYMNNSSHYRHKTFAECSKDNPFYSFGYFCEAIRLRDWAEKKGNIFSLEDYVDTSYIEKALKKSYKNYNEYRLFLIKSFKEQLKEIGITDNYDRIPIDYFERFRWQMSRYCDSRAEFILNNYGYAFSLLSIPEIHEMILTLPANIIRGGKFQTKLIFSIDKKLIRDFYVFSHLRMFRIDDKFNKIKITNYKHIADELFEIFPFVKPMILKVYRRFRYDASKTHSEEALFCIEHRLKNTEYLDISKYNGSLNRLSAFIVGCENILK